MGSWPLWHWPLTSDLDLLHGHQLANGNNSWKFQDDTMTGTLSKRCNRRTDGQTDGQMDWKRAAWSQLQIVMGELANHIGQKGDEIDISRQFTSSLSFYWCTLIKSFWRHGMKTLNNLLTLLWGDPSVTDGTFHVFSAISLNKQASCRRSDSQWCTWIFSLM